MIILLSDSFSKKLKKIKDATLKRKVVKLMKKIINHSSVGKLLCHEHNLQTLRLSSYRVIYSFVNKKITFLDIEHQDIVYKKLKK